MTSEIKPRIVYKLVRTDVPENGTDVYVGSTSRDLKARLREHRADAKRCTNKFHTRMYEVGVYNWEILPLVICPCTEDEIRALEQQWVEMLKPDLNTFSPVDTDNKWGNNGYEKIKKGYYEKHIQRKTYYCDVCDKAYGHLWNLKTHFKTAKHKNKSFEQQKAAYQAGYQAGYREKNKEAIRQRNAEYREKNKEAIRQQAATYYEKNKEAILKQQAAYREKNKEVIRQRAAAYYEKNKEAIRQRGADRREVNKEVIRQRVLTTTRLTRKLLDNNKLPTA